MPNPLYQQLNPQPQNNFANMLQQLKQNPVAILSQKYNIPQNLNDPNQILQYLLSTRQVSQDQVNRAMQMRSLFNQFSLAAAMKINY